MKELINIIGYLFLIIILVFLGAFPFMWLWNYVMPFVFNLPIINYWQSLALICLITYLKPSNFNNK